ncbi:MAG: potassium transporter TrkH [Micavibrio sp.]|nr:potassium transporter TrkH [Micavibrio sp.]
MGLRIVFFSIGSLLLFSAFCMLFPAAIDYSMGDKHGHVFFVSAVLCCFFGVMLCMVNRTVLKENITVKGAFLLTTLAWLTLSVIGALPLYFSDLNLSFTDSFFEAISGISTTGSTILPDITLLSHGQLLWRAMMQMIGGIGIIAFAILLLPFLKVGSMQLFHSESSDKSLKALPKSKDFILSLVSIFFALILLCFATYMALGMTAFEAITYAMTTISTGGYAIYNDSFGHFNSPALEIACMVFMLSGGIPFVLYIRFLYKKEFNFFKDEQVKTFFFVTGWIIIFLTVWLMFKVPGYGFLTSLRYVAFNIISVVTTTGFATIDYTLWGPLAISVFMFVTYLGACSGSTSGGLKFVRLLVIFKTVSAHLKTLRFRHGVFPVMYEGKAVDPSMTMNILGFMCLYVTANAALAVALAMTGLDFDTAISAAATAIANVGPGIGQVIGPAGNFSSLPDTAKWLLSFGMLLGRLEIVTVLILFSPDFWKK